VSVDRYVCCDDQRRAELTSSAANLSGIDYLEVDAGATTNDPTFIDVVLVKPLPVAVAAITADNVHLEGGVRYPAPKVDPTVETLPPGPTVERYRITVPAGELTDFSLYRLSLVKTAGSDDPPTFIDPRLASVEFSFKVSCPTDFDCAACEDDVDDLPPDPEFDYRVRDYPGFRRQLLDRIAELEQALRGRLVRTTDPDYDTARAIWNGAHDRYPALIVRAADVKGQEHAAPEGLGLRAIAHGFAASGLSDEERLERSSSRSMTRCMHTAGGRNKRGCSGRGIRAVNIFSLFFRLSPKFRVLWLSTRECRQVPVGIGGQT